MKTARFTQVVAKGGEPEPYLVLVAPEKDAALQKAIKANRVMTIFQNATGTKADRGMVGFEPGKGRQFLIFPKSLKAFADRSVVGIKYGLLKTKPRPKAKQAARPKPKPKHRPPKRTPARKEGKSSNVIAFKPAEAEEEEDAGEEVEAIKAQVRHAMTVLEQGKQVAAFNLLRRIVEG